MIHVSRRALSSDPGRDWFVTWAYEGGLGATATLKAGNVAATMTPLYVAPCADWDGNYWKAWRLPPVPSGVYNLAVGGVDCGTVVVTAPPPSSYVRVYGVDSPALRTLCSTPGTRVALEGTLRLVRPLYLAPDVTLDARGATVVPDGLNGEAILPATGALVRGGVWQDFDYLMGRYGGGQTVTLDGLTIRHGALKAGGDHHGLLVTDCRFENAAAAMLGYSVVHRCTFDGLADSPATTVWGPEAVFLDNRWTGTDRGINIQANIPVSDTLIACASFVNVVQGENGNELLNLEGRSPITRTLAFHLDARGCNGNLLNTDESATVDGLLVQAARCERNGVFLNGRTPQSGVAIRWLESNGTLDALQGVDGLSIESSAFVGALASRQNQNWFNPRFYDARPVLRSLGRNCRTRDVIVRDYPSDWTRSAGFTEA